MDALTIAAELIRDHGYTVRAGLRSLETGDRYALDQSEWATFHLVRDVVGMAHGFTPKETDAYLKIVCGGI